MAGGRDVHGRRLKGWVCIIYGVVYLFDWHGWSLGHWDGIG